MTYGCNATLRRKFVETALEDRIMLVDTTLTENLSDSFQILNEKVDDMAQGMDIATILNGLAAEAGSS